MGAGAAALGVAAVVAGTDNGGDGDPVVPTDPTDPDPEVDPEVDGPTDPDPEVDGPIDPDPEVDGPTDPDPEVEGPTDPDPEVDGPTDPVDPVEPTPLVVAITGGTQGAGVVVNNDDHTDGVEVSGSGTANASGTITVGGVTHDITVDADGNWTTTYTPEELEGGEYNADVTITLVSGTQTATDTDVVVIDTVAAVSVSVDVVETDGIISHAEEEDGFTLTGTTQAGSTVVVTIDNVDYNAVVDGETWSVEIDAGTIAQGDYDLNVSVTATDNHGNTATTTDVVQIDTVTSLTLDTSAAGSDGVINRVEHKDGVTVGGVAEEFAEVVVTMGDFSHTVYADADGNWTATFTAAETPTGTLTMPVTAVSKDAVGNTAPASGTVRIDTDLDTAIDTSTVEGDGVVNITEHANGVTLTGTADTGAIVTVTFGTGTRVVTAQNGSWSADWTAAEVPTGEIAAAPVTVRAVDDAGNVATANATVRIDTVIDVNIDASSPLTTGSEGYGNDGIVNGVEHANGIRITGTSEGAETVMINFGGSTKPATLAADGTWYADFADSSFASGQTTLPVRVTATDSAGNVDIANSNVVVDTFVDRLASDPGKVEGDDIVNNAEMSNGVTLTGVVEAGSAVSVTIAGKAHTATVVDGNWSVTLDAADIPEGQVNVTINATDRAGNTASISDNFFVDTIAPDAPDIESVNYGDTSVRGFTMLNSETGVPESVHEFVNGSDTFTNAGGGSFINPVTGEEDHSFVRGDYIPDGSHLVVTRTDLAGNSNSTLLVLDSDNTNVVDMSAGAIGNFNIGAIDLEFADNSELTISIADLEGLSQNDNSLIIHGGADDHVTLTGTANPAGSMTINEQTYNVFNVGDNGGELIISADITHFDYDNRDII